MELFKKSQQRHVLVMTILILIAAAAIAIFIYQTRPHLSFWANKPFS